MTMAICIVSRLSLWSQIMKKKPIGSVSSSLSSCFSLAQNCYCKIVLAFLNNLLEVPEAVCNCTLMVRYPAGI